MKKVFIKCETLNGIIVVSLALDEKTKSYKFRRDYSTIGLNATPYSLEINDFTEKPAFKTLEKYIDKSVTEGSILWYMDGSTNFPCPIVVYTQDLHNCSDESDRLNYTIVPDIQSNCTQPEVSTLNKSVDIQDNCPKRVKQGE